MYQDGEWHHAEFARENRITITKNRKVKTMALNTGQFTVRSTWGSAPSGFPEDAEEQDKAAIEKFKEEYMQSMYPSFEPEIVSTLQKDYFLPALKVLIRTPKGLFFSPSRVTEWKGGELIAECRSESSMRVVFPKFTFRLTNGNIEAYTDETQYELKPIRHIAPDDDCDCGVYGSVNLDEIIEYMSDGETIRVEGTRPRGKLTLCIVEPLPDADVILCRKGWKAGGAFISEIVDETISVVDTSRLLSMTWKREIDIRRLFNENR